MEFIKITNSVWLKADNCSVEPTWPKHTLFFLVWKITLHICKLCLQFSHETYCKTSFLFVWYIHNDPKLHFVTISFGSLTLLKISFSLMSHGVLFNNGFVATISEVTAILYHGYEPKEDFEKQKILCKCKLPLVIKIKAFSYTTLSAIALSDLQGSYLLKTGTP